MTRVFLPEATRKFDLTSAEEFGELTPLTEGIDPFDPTSASEAIMSSFILHGFDPTKDLLCMTGKSISLAITLSVAVMLHERIRLLMFDARSSTYKVRVMERIKDAR